MVYKRKNLDEKEGANVEALPNNVAAPKEVVGGIPISECYGLLRKKEGWHLVIMQLPEHVMMGYRIAEDGPHGIDMVSAKLAQLVSKRGYSVGK